MWMGPATGVLRAWPMARTDDNRTADQAAGSRVRPRPRGEAQSLPHGRGSGDCRGEVSTRTDRERHKRFVPCTCVWTARTTRPITEAWLDLDVTTSPRMGEQRDSSTTPKHAAIVACKRKVP